MNKKKWYCESEKLSILAKAKRQLSEYDICNFKIIGASSNSTSIVKSQQINYMRKDEDQLVNRYRWYTTLLHKTSSNMKYNS